MTNAQATHATDLSSTEKRLRRIRQWDRVPASLQLLRFMADEGGITSRQGATFLDCPLQTARNACCKLVRQGRASVVRGLARSEFATYSITPKGCAALDAADEDVTLNEAQEDAIERLIAAQEAADQLARIEAHISRALRRAVPCSVFDLGRCVSAGARA